MIPTQVLELVRQRMQPHARNKKKMPVIVLLDASRPIVDTYNGRTCVIVGKDFLCGDYYDR